jgi:hypothetical protein
VTQEVLARAGISESLIPRTLYALRALDLIDEGGAPTPIFETLRLAPENEYQKRQEDWLKAAYADVFSFVDPTTDDETRVRDAFRSYQPIAQQSRMVTLFQGLCVAAGLMPEKKSESKPRAIPVRATATIRHVAPRTPATATRKSLFAPALQHQEPSRSLPPALSGLLKAIPDASRGWTQTDRDKFYSTFGTVLDFSIPIRKEAELNENGGQE